MGRDYYAEVFYGCVFTLEEVIAKKNITTSPEMKKYIDDTEKKIVLDFLHDLINESYRKKVFLNNSSIPWIEEEFYVFITESVVKTKESWVKKIDILDDFELKKEFWNRQIKKFCEEHSIPYKEPAWHLQLASF